MKFCLILISFAVLVFSGCSGNQDNANTTATTNVSPPPTQVLRVVAPPQEILEQKKSSSEEDAKPELRIVSPTEGSVVVGPVVAVKLQLGGDLKGYKPHQDTATGKGNHIHVILDNEPYEAYYDLDKPFEFRNVAAGKHILRVFPSRPWHESYKNDGAFQMVTFTVKDGGDAASATTTNSGQTMANNNAPQARGKSVAGDVDPRRPLLTYSRPKGEYKGSEADPIMIDFWLTNAKLRGDGGEYRVRYIVDDDEPRFIDKWEPLWLAGWLNGTHTLRLELLGPDNWPVKNGSFNVATREITVVK